LWYCCLGKLRLLCHLHGSKTDVGTCDKPARDCLSDALTTAGLRLHRLPFERCYLRSLGIFLGLVGLPDAFLFLLLDGSQRLLFGLLLQEDVASGHCPASGSLDGSLLQANSLEVSRDTHLRRFCLASESCFFLLRQPESAACLTSAQAPELALLLSGQALGISCSRCADSSSDTADGFSCADTQEAERKGIYCHGILRGKRSRLLRPS
jgi:hypothetical protein